MLFTDVPDPQLSSSYLLHARSAVCPHAVRHDRTARHSRRPVGPHQAAPRTSPPSPAWRHR
ncbi:hypothetical protein LV779_25530 [Streptomyces thinghirensis]|nr:hypothetical protein [Streptomyces thinghirensis]